ncbi:hypothetical protein TNCV_2771631 [Trichonephila clavipes]|nr:hypothetical protein TNCV_2771631 [Trichonephila clavipes]
MYLHLSLIEKIENPISWKNGVWEDVSMANLVLSREDLMINIYPPLQTASGGKFISTTSIAVVAFSSYNGRERVKRNRSLPKICVGYTFIESFAYVNAVASNVKSRLSSLVGFVVHKYVSFSMRVLVKAVTAKCLGGPPVDRDQLNAYLWSSLCIFTRMDLRRALEITLNTRSLV